MDELDGLTLDFAARHPDSFARTLAQGATEDIERILESMPAALKASIVARLPAALIRMLLEVERHQPGNWLIDAPFDDAVMLLSRIPREKRLALVNSLHERDRRLQLLRLQQYPAHSIGALVADIALRISVDTPAAAVLAELRELDIAEQGPVVIVDAAGHYLGTLDRWRLLMRNPQSGTPTCASNRRMRRAASRKCRGTSCAVTCAASARPPWLPAWITCPEAVPLRFSMR